MSWLTLLCILTPVLFVVGLIYNAYKEQKRLENGELQEILKERRAEEEAYKARTGKTLIRKDPYEDEDDH